MTSADYWRDSSVGRARAKQPLRRRLKVDWYDLSDGLCYHRVDRCCEAKPMMHSYQPMHQREFLGMVGLHDKADAAIGVQQ